VCESRAVLHARAYIIQFLPELVKQCICVSFNKVMVGVHVMSKFVALLHGSQLCLERLARTGRKRGQYLAGGKRQKFD